MAISIVVQIIHSLCTGVKEAESDLVVAICQINLNHASFQACVSLVKKGHMFKQEFRTYREPDQYRDIAYLTDPTR